MIILGLRTDKENSELWLANDGQVLETFTWLAHRTLAATIHEQLAAMLERHDLELHNLGAVVIYKGPGSFTGLRIGAAVGNALAYAYNVPVVGETDEDWFTKGSGRLLRGKNDKIVLPEYGAEANISRPKK